MDLADATLEVDRLVLIGTEPRAIVCMRIVLLTARNRWLADAGSSRGFVERTVPHGGPALRHQARQTGPLVEIDSMVVRRRLVEQMCRSARSRIGSEEQASHRCARPGACRPAWGRSGRVPAARRISVSQAGRLGLSRGVVAGLDESA